MGSTVAFSSFLLKTLYLLTLLKQTSKNATEFYKGL